ncbi:hypothetical protein EJ02DRAFT_367703 [Clathrospora elynae]|uniref:Uncharacterized protein n=1 Tax=Clathrospora elynae TaxID=706981 RepID=A0A6A5T2T7_9PLEO|nr:hypothetical protein EJ02DRAFT_367703 [Clathrospora elynae]
MSSITPTTTYPFRYTTYTNPSPAPFTTPTIIPSFFSWGSAVDCASNTRDPDFLAQPSNYPIGRPLGLQPACVISNAAEVNDHAFWDLYDCCTGKDMFAFGSPYTCTAECRAEKGQSFQQLGECLSKRVEVVVCSPQFEEMGGNGTEGGGGSSLAAQSTSGKASASASGTASASAARSSMPAASTGGVGQTASLKFGLLVFGTMAVGSAAGMLL